MKKAEAELPGSFCSSSERRGVEVGWGVRAGATTADCPSFALLRCRNDQSRASLGFGMTSVDGGIRAEGEDRQIPASFALLGCRNW
jgi:hypothetical protein